MIQIPIKYALVLALAQAPGHGRALAKSVGASQPTVARALRELEENGIATAQRQGRNKVYALADTYAARHALAAAEHEKATAFLAGHPREAVTFTSLLRRTSATMVILFGSYADGTERKGSDYDLYLDITREERDELGPLHTKLRIQAGRFDKATALAQEIIRKHVILRGVDGFLTLTRPERKWQAGALRTLDGSQ